MELANSDYTLIMDTLTLFSLLGEFHNPLTAIGYAPAKGLILCNDSPSEGDRWIGNLRQLKDITEITSIRRQYFSVPNFHLGLYFFQKYDSVENIRVLLKQDSFQPLVVCNSIVPDELVDLADTVSLPLDSLANNTPSFAELANCKQFFRESPNNLMVALTQAVTSKNFLELQNAELDFLLVDLLTIVAEVFLFWFRSQHSEEETTIRKNTLQLNMQKLSQNHLNNYETVDLADTFVHVFYEYLNSHSDISYCPFNRVEGDALIHLKSGQTILWDSNYYFISCELMKTICQPLLKEIGWQKILSNLTREGIISVSSNQQANYTRKRTVYNAFGQIERPRFIYLNKESLRSNDYISPEERGKDNGTVPR